MVAAVAIASIGASAPEVIRCLPEAAGLISSRAAATRFAPRHNLIGSEPAPCDAA
jgi:hypothetical protein